MSESGQTPNTQHGDEEFIEAALRELAPHSRDWAQPSQEDGGATQRPPHKYRPEMNGLGFLNSMLSSKHRLDEVGAEWAASKVCVCFVSVYSASVVMFFGDGV